jgi:hypothetical protein
MNDAGLRRLLERATAQPPADLEARVFRARRHPWRWTAAAAAVVLVAGVVGWSLAGEPEPGRAVTHEPPPTAGLGVHPIGTATGRVATWLPEGFRETARDAQRTTWTGKSGDTITVGLDAGLDAGQRSPEFSGREVFAPGGYAAEASITDDQVHLRWCNGSSCALDAKGVSELDALRVAVGIASRGRVERSSSSTTVATPDVLGRPINFAQQPLDDAGLRTRVVFGAPAGPGTEEFVLSQAPAAGGRLAAEGFVTLVVGAQEKYDGFEAVRDGGEVVGWVDTRLSKVDGPQPVVSFRKEERLQGYLIPGRGFRWLDELALGSTDIPATESVDAPGARGVALGHGSLWVARQRPEGPWVLERRDPVTGGLGTTIDVPGIVRAVVVGDDMVAAFGGSDGAYPEGGVAIIDPASNQVLGTYGWDGGAIVSPYFGVATDDAIWVTDAVRDQVVRFQRSASGAIEMRRFPVSGQPTMIAATPSGTVWVQQSMTGRVAHLDGRSGSLLSTAELPGILAADGLALWSGDGERTVAFDTVALEQGAVSAAEGARLPVRAGALVVDGDGVWLAPLGGGLQRWLRADFDDATPKPRASLGPDTGAAPWSFAAVDGSLWFVTLDGLSKWTPSIDDLAKPAR